MVAAWQLSSSTSMSAGGRCVGAGGWFRCGCFRVVYGGGVVVVAVVRGAEGAWTGGEMGRGAAGGTG